MNLRSESPPHLFTVGHSNHAMESFIDLLKQHDIHVLADTRSSPYSRYVTHFNKEELHRAMTEAGIKYLFLGKELGGRPNGEEFYDEEGRVLYYRLAESPLFLEGIERLEKGIRQYRVALMCSEEDPTVCHRHRLVARVMVERGVQVSHIRGDGAIETVTIIPARTEQRSLFDLPEENNWKSLRPVSPKRSSKAEEEEPSDPYLDD